MSAEKKEGAEQTCKCGTDLICVKIISEWNGKKEEKLQWQNKSNLTPHFRWVSEGKYDCVLPDESYTTPMEYIPPMVTEPSPTNLNNFMPKLLTPQELQLWNDILEKIKEYYIVAKQNLQNDGNIEEIGAVHGLISNQAFTVLNTILQKKRDEE